MKLFPDPPGLDVYRIGHPGRPHPDRWRRTWQAEWTDCMWAPRAWTRRGATRKARRWRHRNTDVHRHEHLYGRNNTIRAARGMQ